MALLFPYQSQREGQKDLVAAALTACEKRKHLLAHAPTGLGKTAAALAPAITVALRDDLTVFFVTARHTQHLLALRTVHDIERAHDTKIPVLNLIGKKWLCLQPGAERLYSNEFMEFCRALREDKRCSYYENLKRGTELSSRTNAALAELAASDGSTDAIMTAGKAHLVCPYEIALLHGQRARVIIADYAYVFNEGIREPFFQKLGLDLAKTIPVVDEAHNLPDRVKDLASVRISTFMLKRAQAENDKYQLSFHQTLGAIERMLGAIREDRFLEREELIVPQTEIEEMTDAADTIREEQRSSFIGSIAEFLSAWSVEREGFARIAAIDRGEASISYRCLDPGVVTGPVFEASAASIVMSGTLTPTQMYLEVLDMPVDTRELTLPSPFPAENRLVLVIPKTTTKFTARSREGYAAIASHVADIASSVPGNCIAFFPSYDILGAVKQDIMTRTTKTIFEEVPGLSKTDRESLLTRFRSYQASGALLLAVTAGSFGEGIDLPGDELKAVIIIGLPLSKPTKEVEALIAYYDKKFGRGWDYGYVVPAFNKVLQSAGRTIRTETDRGAIIFLDERYAWPQYQRLFPPEWKVTTTILWQKYIAEFFNVQR